MAINQNHLFEDLDGVKCAIVEKNASAQRVAFLRSLLEYNRFTVIVVPSPPPKAAPAAPPAGPAPVSPTPMTPGAAPSSFEPAATTAPATPAPSPANPTPSAVPVSAPVAAPAPVSPPPPETFTVGVTDTTFNPTNAIFGRLLHTPDGHIVTLAYWKGVEKQSHDEIPYFQTGKG